MFGGGWGWVGARFARRAAAQQLGLGACVVVTGGFARAHSHTDCCAATLAVRFPAEPFALETDWKYKLFENPAANAAGAW